MRAKSKNDGLSILFFTMDSIIITLIHKNTDKRYTTGKLSKQRRIRTQIFFLTGSFKKTQLHGPPNHDGCHTHAEYNPCRLECFLKLL